MKVKYIISATCIILSVILAGCGQKKSVKLSEDYEAKEISKICIDNDSWQLEILPSTDKKVHVSLEGSTDKNSKVPSINLKDNVLNIQQTEGDTSGLNQIAMGKQGQVTIYLPAEIQSSIQIKNGSGDIEMNNITSSQFLVDNESGYGTFTNITSDDMKISSTSGDMKVSNGHIGNVQIDTASGYVTLEKVKSKDTVIITKSGEVNISDWVSQSNLEVKTNSGDIGISSKKVPDDLSFDISAASEDISAELGKASYEIDKPSCKKGNIGKGEYTLVVNSDSGTVVVK